MVAISNADSPSPSPSHHRKRTRLMKLQEEDEEDDYVTEKEKEEEEEPPLEDAKPIGEPVRVSGRGMNRVNHFHSFEFDGNQYKLVSIFIISSFSRFLHIFTVIKNVDIH